MNALGTPLTSSATRVLLLGAGELGKEVAIELQRLGVEVIAADRYANAPAMQVAHRSHVLDMLDGQALAAFIAAEKPHLVVPEIEAIATAALVELEAAGQRVVPTARAAQLTMDREGIRRLAAETLGLPTSPYRFVDDVAAVRHLHRRRVRVAVHGDHFHAEALQFDRHFLAQFARAEQQHAGGGRRQRGTKRGHRADPGGTGPHILAAAPLPAPLAC